MPQLHPRRVFRLLAAPASLVTAFFLQTVLFPRLGIEVLVPDLILGAVVAAALILEPIPAILIGTGAGLLQDSFTGGLLGLNGFSKALIAFCVARVHGFLRIGSVAAAGMVVTIAVIPDAGLHWGLRTVTAAAPISPERWMATLYGLPVTVAYGLLSYRVLVWRWDRDAVAGHA